MEGESSGTLSIHTVNVETGLVAVQITGKGIIVFIDPKVDFSGNGRVDFADFLLFVSAFGKSDPEFDLDGDGIVNFTDFLDFIVAFGRPVSDQ